ncbi:MAG TPA: tetratricopeptide repeat protein [Flavobacteriales bacterium]|nr:tetratricopeptide repeat protein [Flavobacteriales bacterium]HRP81486.1 tetratricopeptide repeat protein [Flavobacteriales bacterium]
MATAGSTYLARAKRSIAAHGRDGAAFELLSKAADAGNAEAIYAIGTWYLFGTHVRKNFRQAAGMLQRAADLGHASANFDLAVSYEKGKGVERDRSKAFSLYMKAALLGDEQATFEVGRCFHWGIGTLRDRQAAEVWFKAFKRFGGVPNQAAARKPKAKRQKAG